MPQIKPFQIDTAELGQDSDLQSNITITEARISDLQSYLLNLTSEPVGDLSDVAVTSLTAGELLVSSGSPLGWINQTAAEAGLASAYHIDVTTSPDVGSPLGGSPLTPGMIDTTLPAGWSTAYNSVGNFTITHNLGNTEIGFALSVIYSGTARVLNPTTITTNAVTFQITDTLDAAVDGNVVGKLLF